MKALKVSRPKENFYIFSFTCLGILMGLLVWGMISLVLIRKNYLINSNIYLAVMLTAGAVAGFEEGRRWWKIIYVEKAYLHWPKTKLQYKLIGVAVLLILTIGVVAFFGNYLN
jgi:hypothetical protein